MFLIYMTNNVVIQLSLKELDEYIAKAVAPLYEKINNLEKEVAELKNQFAELKNQFAELSTL